MAALQAAKRASKLEDQLRAARAEQEVLVTQSEEASARVAAAQAARDRAVKEVVIPCSPSHSAAMCAWHPVSSYWASRVAVNYAIRVCVWSYFYGHTMHHMVLTGANQRQRQMR